MALLALSHVEFGYGSDTILDDVTVAVEPGRKIGVIGQNGTGKSTLMRLLTGALEPTDGVRTTGRGARIAFQAQELVVDPGDTVRDQMRRVFAAELARADRLAEIETALAADPDADTQRRLLGEYERLQREHEAAGGYEVERRIATVLSSLGLPKSAWDQAVDRFSGGERNIIGLAGVLLSRPDVMLLDEPSNHLDTWGLEWFVDFVRGTDRAIVMVSHNRYVLDRCVDEIWEVRKGHVTAWTGNYSSFREQKQKALDLQERQFRVQEKEIARLEFQARRQRDMANAYDDPAQARRAKNMERRAERLRKVDAPDRTEDRFHASLRGGKRHGDIALAVDGLTVAYGDRTILDGVELTLEYGDRVCLVGPNGCGKTTLFHEVLAERADDDTSVRIGAGVIVGEYSQLHDVLDHSVPLLEFVADATRLTNSESANLLHRFLFTRDDLQRSIGTLSGGEKSRVQLLRLAHAKVNLLLLDEPTNHLDIQACEQLEAMLADYDGTLLVISHDRTFLDGLVNRVVEIRDQRLHVMTGTFSDWWDAKRAAGEDTRRAALELRSVRAADTDAKSAAREEREARKARQRELRRLQREIQRLEARIVRLEEQQEALTTRLQAAYEPGSDPDVARAISVELADIQGEMKSLYSDWERAASALEEV